MGTRPYPGAELLVLVERGGDMTKVRVCIEIKESDLTIYEKEAQRRGMKVEKLLEQMVDGLIKELKEQERQGTDFEITP